MDVALRPDFGFRPGDLSQQRTRPESTPAWHAIKLIAKVVGPSWKDISDKYKDGSKTSAQLAASIKAGGRQVGVDTDAGAAPSA